jgi:hypothetical protein
VAGAAVLGVWVLSTGLDHWHQAERYLSGREVDPLAPVVTGLLEGNVRVAQAGYWRAYKLTFLTGERVVVASTDVVRIASYQEAAAREGAALRELRENPCPGGRPIGGWYLCAP